jgi:hypothetical protein
MNPSNRFPVLWCLSYFGKQYAHEWIKCVLYALKDGADIHKQVEYSPGQWISSWDIAKKIYPEAPELFDCFVRVATRMILPLRPINIGILELALLIFVYHI